MLRKFGAGASLEVRGVDEASSRKYPLKYPLPYRLAAHMARVDPVFLFSVFNNMYESVLDTKA